MEKVGFFGGCFNPVTNAHINLVKDAIKKENLSKVYFVPMGDIYSKKGLIPLEYRIEMLRLVFENEDKLEILDISNKTKKTYAIDTFKFIEKQFPECDRFFIMGSDNYKKINSWKDSNILLKNFNYIILDRENGNTKDISSSMVREKIKLNESLNDFIPSQVEEYIKEKNLYK